MNEAELAVFEAQICVTAYTVLPDIVRKKAPVEAHLLAEGIEP